MSLFDALRHRLRPLFHSRAYDRDLDEELRHHRELASQEDPESASRFGSPAYYKEETRRLTLLGALDLLGQDLRYAGRSLHRTPGFTAVAVLSLAIGIGANSAIFSLIYSILLQPLPVAHPEQLVVVQHAGPEMADDGFSYNAYQSLRQSPGVTALTAQGGAAYVPVVAGAARTAVNVDAVDGNFFSTLGLRPLAGRLLTPDDERARAPVTVISEGLWTEWFDRSPAAIGSSITMRGTAFTVVGVTPPSFQGLAYPGSFDAAVPLSTLPLVGGTPVETAGADSLTLEIVGRVAHPAALAGAERMMDATYRSCCATALGGPSGLRLAGIEHGIVNTKFDVHALFGRLLFEILGAAGIVLLAACANLGTLLLARASARERELAVRLSLGASRRRLAAQLLVESALLAALGAGAGLLLARWALGLIAHRLPAPIGQVGFVFTGDVLGFTAAVAIAAVLLFGAVPAWRATRTDLIAPLNEGGRLSAGRRAGWLDRSLVVAQVALALVLINGAGLFVATLRNLRNVNGGFALERTLSAELDSRGTAYENAGLATLMEPLLSRAAGIPGVRSAALSLAVPVFGGRRVGGEMAVQGYTPRPDENMTSWLDPVTPGFFATLGIGVRQGRDFSADDRAAGQPVAIVNEAFVHQYLRDRNPLGTTVRSLLGPDTTLLQIVGVAGDARFAGLRDPAPPMIFVPLAQFVRIPGAGHLAVLVLTVRTAGDDRALSPALRNAVFGEAPAVRLDGPETIEEGMDAALNRETLTAELATLFGAVALLLAGIGLYGVVSYQVVQRTREIGVRMALGAAAPAVVWMVLKQALVLVAFGVLVGTPLAVSGGKAIGALLYGLGGENRFFVLGAGALLAAVAVAASALPARRAAQVDPLIALRAD